MEVHPKSGLLRFHYDQEADILRIGTCRPHAEQETEELGDVIARMNPETDEIESIEILIYSSRLEDGGAFDLPIQAQLRRAD